LVCFGESVGACRFKIPVNIGVVSGDIEIATTAQYEETSGHVYEKYHTACISDVIYALIYIN